MYEKPVLQRFGPLRDLTLIGLGESYGFLDHVCGRHPWEHCPTHRS